MSWYRLHQNQEMTEYNNAEVAALIDNYIHKERDRAILKRRLCDGVCFEPLAEEFKLSVRQTKRIVYKGMDLLSRKI